MKRYGRQIDIMRKNVCLFLAGKVLSLRLVVLIERCKRWIDVETTLWRHYP